MPVRGPAVPPPLAPTRPRMPGPALLLAAALAAAVALTATACGSPASAGAGSEAADTGQHAHHGTGGAGTAGPEIEAAEPAGYSIYHAASVWTDQTGARRPLAALRGRPRVVAMVYTSCAYACPRIMLDMKRIEGELGPGLQDRVGFVLVTIDPERDTPERLARFASGSRLDPGRWTLLTGHQGDILELAALLGVQYRRTGDAEFVHSNLITVLDADGVVVHRQRGLGTDPAATLAVLRRLLE